MRLNKVRSVVSRCWERLLTAAFWRRNSRRQQMLLVVARRCGFLTLNNLEFIKRGERERSSPSMLSGLDFAPWREGITLHTIELKGFIVLVLLRLLCRFWMLDTRRRSRPELLQSGVWITFCRFVQPDGKKYLQGPH